MAVERDGNFIGTLGDHPLRHMHIPDPRSVRYREAAETQAAAGVGNREKIGEVEEAFAATNDDGAAGAQFAEFVYDSELTFQGNVLRPVFVIECPVPTVLTPKVTALVYMNEKELWRLMHGNLTTSAAVHLARPFSPQLEALRARIPARRRTSS